MRLFFVGIILQLLLWNCIVCDGYIVDPGPKVKPTRGAVWPQPQQQNISKEFFTINPRLFQFNVINKDCTILEQALQRYWNILNKVSTQKGRKAFNRVVQPKNQARWIKELSTLNVDLTTECTGNERPEFQMNEHYFLQLDKDVTKLSSSTIWGMLRGLETFSQLLHYSHDESMLVINATSINDYPRYSHRGLLIDTARHYEPLENIFDTLDAMAYNKLNVFHWHIVDDQSFPYVSVKFPEMSQRGAYHPEMIYTVYDVDKVIEYARVRGIRVLVEFDTPGHTRSWGEGVPDLLTPCYGDYEGKFGPIMPARDFVYQFLKEFFQEVVNKFPDKYVHLGGDEVGFECWSSNPEINQFMDKLNITGDYEALESYYIQKLIDIINGLQVIPIVWEEVFLNGVKISNNTIVHVWRDNFNETLKNVTAAGYYTLLSSCWYLDHLQSGGDWKDFYTCEPTNFEGTPQQKALVLGGEACMWAEVVNEHNLMSRVWPRACAVAERLWSKQGGGVDSKVESRLEEHTCRMNRRGIAAQPPNGPGFCV